MQDLAALLLERSQPERLATGFTFTESLLWHPDGSWSFVVVRESRFYRALLGHGPFIPGPGGLPASGG